MKIYKMLTSFVLIVISSTVINSQDNSFAGQEENLEAGEEFEIVLEIYNPRTKTLEAQSEVFSSGMPISFTSGMMTDSENDVVRFEGSIEINPLNNRGDEDYRSSHSQFLR